jgi:hypothetical protein
VFAIESGEEVLTCVIVSEPIALEIVSFNGGSYTGAILFTGFMYIGAAAMLWLVRAWKVGELERKAAAVCKDSKNVGPLSSEPASDQEPAAAEVKVSPFVKRLVVWARV